MKCFITIYIIQKKKIIIIIPNEKKHGFKIPKGHLLVNLHKCMSYLNPGNGGYLCYIFKLSVVCCLYKILNLFYLFLSAFPTSLSFLSSCGRYILWNLVFQVNGSWACSI